jgi:hypothetical protein
MRLWVTLSLVAAAIIIAAYGEFILDIRSADSDLIKQSALGAGASLSLDEYHRKMDQMRTAYGLDRAKVILDPQTGEMTVELDGKVIEKGRVERIFSYMYGLFAVTSREGQDNMFPFVLTPGELPLPLDHEPNIERLRARFESILPAKFLAFKDSDWTRDSCVTLAPPSKILGDLASLLRLQAHTSCIVHWNGTRPASMLVGVTLAHGDPWMRPFARRICRHVTSAMLRSLTAPDREPPTYAACVLVDRPARTGPRGAQDAFTSVVYEVRNHALARMD